VFHPFSNPDSGEPIRASRESRKVINFFLLYADGMQIPSRPLQPNFSRDEPLYVEAYHTLFSGNGIHFLTEGNSISKDDYSRGFSLFAFDLTPRSIR